MKKIAIIGVSKKQEVWDFVKSLSSYEKKYDVKFEPFIYTTKDFQLYDRLSTSDSNCEDYVAAIAAGGDGTFLYTSRVFAGTDVPIFGLNFGKLGFNTTIETKDFSNYFERFMNNNVDFEYKSLIDVQIENDEKIYSVLNDAVVTHAGISRVVRVHVALEGQTICDFNGDGVIISSPTGSTAYNLSAGGPILHPDVNAFVVCPVCPHTLAIRPFIIPFSETIELSVEESLAEPQITLDGQKIIMLQIGQKMIFRKSDKKAKVVKGKWSFSEILKLKLGWTA